MSDTGSFVDLWVPVAISLALIVVAFFLYRKFRHRVSVVQSEIRGATHAVSAYRKGDESLDGLSSRLAAMASLRQPWTRLRRATVEISGVDDPASGRIVLTRPAGDFINVGEVLAPAVNLRFYTAVPNMLVGAGLFFTFVGLVLALLIASSALNTLDSDETRRALQDLLHAATFKFLTSLAGLLGSLVFSWAEKDLLHRVNVDLDGLVDALEDAFGHLSAEQLAIERNHQLARQQALLGQQLAVLSRQEARLQAMEEGLPSTLSSALDQKLGPRFDALGTQLGSALDRIAENIGSASEQALREMVQQFVSALDAGAAQHVAALAGTVTEVSGQLRGAGDHLASVVGSSAEQLVAACEVLEGSAVQLKAQVVDLGVVVETASTKGDQLLAQLSAANNALESVSSAIEQGSNGIADAEMALREAVKATGQAIREFGQMGNQTAATVTGLVDHARTELAKSIADMGRERSQAIASLQQMLEKAAQGSASLGAASTAIREVSDALQAAWRSYQAKFADVDESLAEVFTTLQDGLGRYTDEVGKFHQSMDEKLAEALASLGGFLSELNVTLETFSEASRAAVAGNGTRGRPS